MNKTWNTTQTEVSEFIEKIYRCGDDADRHLVLLTEMAADLVGAISKPKLKTRDEPDAHVDIHLRKEGGVLIYFWTADEDKKWITLTHKNPKTQSDLEIAARERPADLIESELLNEYIHGF